MRTLLALTSLVALVWIIPNLRAEEETDTAAAFPASWVGHWKGPGRSVKRTGRNRPVGMELHVAPLEDGDGYSWTVEFDSVNSYYEIGPEHRTHHYELHPVDPATGHWRLHTIGAHKVDAYLVGDTLQCLFRQRGPDLIGLRYEMRDGTIEMRIDVYDAGLSKATEDEDGVWIRPSYELHTVQTARLRRVESDK